ncbi:12279_t:CDS:1, partial [Gigaspora margarita]
IVIRNLYNILNEQDIYIKKYGGHVKNYNYPKNLKYNRDFSYNKKREEDPYVELERASTRAKKLAELGIFGDLDSKTDSD